MQTHKKLKARILSLALSAAMVTTMMPTTVFATEGGNVAPGASSLGVIQSFDKLDSRFDPSTGKDAPSHVYGLAVELDTPEEDLNLPTELTAMVARTTTVSTPSDAEDEPVVDSGKVDEPAEDETIPDADTTIPDEDEVTGEDADDTVSGNQPATPSDATEDVTEEEVPLAPAPEQDEETTTTVEQETIPVTWNSDKEYVSDEKGQFIYTAEISEDYILADGVELPQIYVFVGRQARASKAGNVAQIGEQGYATLQAAFDAVTNGQTIKILENIDLGTTGTTLNKSGASVTLDLNGKTITASGTNTAITLSNGSLAITDTASGGTVSATAGKAIYNSGTGAVTVSGGTVSATGRDRSAVYNNSTGTVTVSGGTVSATGELGTAIFNNSTGTVTVSGGTVSAAGATGIAIYNKSTGLITISQAQGKTTLITSENSTATEGTIYLAKVPTSAPKTVLNVQGGTVANTVNPEGNSVYFGATGVTSTNLSDYYTKTGGATVGKIFPEPAGDVSVTFSNLTANGTANTVATTALTLTFDKDVTGLAASDIVVTGATKGALTKESGTGVYELAISGITVAEGENVTVAVAKTGFTFTPASKTVAVHKEAKTLSSIAVTTQPTKTTYTAGETFDKAGMVVTATYSDNSTAAVIGYTFAPSGALATSDTKVTVSYTEGSVTKTADVNITVNAAALTGTVAITGTLKFDQQLTAALNDGNNTGTLSYQWKRGGTVIGSNSNTYTTVEADIGQTLTCVVTSSVETGSITGTASGAIAKADGPAAPGVTFSFDGSNANKLMSATTAMEYSLDGGSSYTDCTTDMDLTSVLSSINATNDIKVRVKVTSTTNVGAVKTIDITAGAAVSGVTAEGCTTSSNNDGKLKGVTAAMEYKLSTASTWTAGTGSDITGLANGTYNVRTKATGTALAGAESNFTVSAYSASALTGTVAITGTLKFGQQLTATLNGGNNTGTLSYQWKRGNTVIGSNSNTYTTVEADIGQTLTCEVKSSVQTGTLTGTASGAIAKADGPVAPSVTFSFDGSDANKLKGATSAMEYSLNGGSSYTDCTTDMDLTSVLSSITAANDIKVRVKATTTTNEGAVKTIDITAGAAVTGVTAEACTTSSNNDGKLKGVTAAMEYKLSTASAWSAGTGSDITGLANGTYNVRTKATGTTLVGAESNFTVSAYSATTYTVTISGGGTGATGAGSYAADATVSINAGSKSGYSFSGWTSSDVTFANASSASTSFTMPSKAVTVTANWTYNGGGSSGGGGGGSSSDSGSSTPATKPTEPVQGSTNTSATVDQNGNANVTVSDKNITDAIKAAKDEASKKGVNAGEVTVVINVATGGKDANTVTVNLPKTTQQQVINNKVDNVALVIEKPDINISLNLATITEINKQANADVQLSATRMDNSKLSGEAKAAIGNRPTFDLKATYANGSKSVTNFGAGSVSVAIPYTLQAGEVAGGLYAVYIDGNGKANYITGSSYDTNAKMVRFATNHFSVYGIGYKAPLGFTDIASHWAKTDIEFVANRGLMSGTSNTTFSPNGSMTRGMFVTALGRLAGVDTNSYKNGKFTDVSATAYYAPYVNWAAEKGITSGTTATTFSPDNTVTRQEMAVFMSNYAKAMGYKVPETRAAVTFADNGSIGSWAAAAVKQMQMAGVLNGKNGNKFDPTGTATRAEVAAVLHRYVELVIDRTTAQGLDTNDSGSAVMYENGKMVKSASRTVGSATYNFNANGEATAKTNTAGATATPPALPAGDNKYTWYTVKKGDWISKIAITNNCTVEEIIALNGIKNKDLIFEGQQLKVPQK